MRTSQVRLIALFVLLSASLIPASASATTVVDQYTEQVPSAGGPVINGPGGNGGNTGAPVSGSPGSDGAVPAGADSSTASSNGANGDGGVNGNGGAGQGGNLQGETASGSEGAVAGTESGMASTSDTGGISWLFPAALLGIAAAMAAVFLGRRKRNDLATK